MAIFLEYLSAKLGIATERNLPEMCGEHFNRRTNRFLYGFAELGAMATDLAEFLGATLGFYLIFGIPLIYAGLLWGFRFSVFSIRNIIFSCWHDGWSNHYERFCRFKYTLKFKKTYYL